MILVTQKSLFVEEVGMWYFAVDILETGRMKDSDGSKKNKKYTWDLNVCRLFLDSYTLFCFIF